jgi:hypothetical protein
MISRSVFSFENLTKWGFVPAFVFVLWPFANFAGFNLVNGETVSFYRLAGAFFAVYAITFLIIIVACLLLPKYNKYKIAFLVSVLMCLNMSYALLRADVIVPFLETLSLPETQLAVDVCIVTIALICTWIVLYFGQSKVFRSLTLAVLFLSSVLTLGMPFLTKASGVGGAGSYDSTLREVDGPARTSAGKRNVYFFMLDGHPRFDVLRDVYHYDASKLQNAMEKLGFYVVEKSHSNYPVTVFSLTGTFNMKLPDKTMPLKIHNFNSDYVRGRSSPALTAFRERGYKVAWTTNGFLSWTSCGGLEDVCIQRNDAWVKINLQERAVIRMTYLYRWVSQLLTRLNQLYLYGKPPTFMNALTDTALAYNSFSADSIRDSFDELPDEPYFWFAHMLATHNPNAGPNCGYMASGQGNWGAPHLNHLTQHFDYYLQCLHAQLTRSMEALVKHDPDAIIIVQSDHGSNGRYGSLRHMRERPTANWNKVDIDELFGNLSMIRLPKECRDMLHPKLTPVNNFPIIFSCIDGKNYAQSDNFSYLAAYNGWWADHPQVVKFLHHENQNYPEPKPNDLSHYYTNKSVSADVGLIFKDAEKYLQKYARGEVQEGLDATGWTMGPEVVLAEPNGSLGRVAYRLDVTAPQCTRISHLVRGLPRGPQGVNKSFEEFQATILSGGSVDLKPFTILQHRVLTCIQTTDNKIVTYLKLPTL